MKIGVLLSGNGVFDGSEIHEAVLALLAIDEHNAESICIAPDIDQHHVINHISGEEMSDKRNVLIEASRIARGKIKNLVTVTFKDFDALVIPGGFGAAKNLTKWAFKGPEGDILSDVRRLIIEMISDKKPVCGLCMGPAVIAKALDGLSLKPLLTIGTVHEPSPYDISYIGKEMETTGATVSMKTIREIEIDYKNKIVTAPCYMMEASISQIHENIRMAIKATVSLI